jgi:hypothetical protein
MRNLVFFIVLSCILLTLSCTKSNDDTATSEIIALNAETGNPSPFEIIGANPCYKPEDAPGLVAVGTDMSTQHITLKADVKNKGKYTYRTNETNGYYFAASGTFTSKGIQAVTLNGHGTAQTPGQDRFILRHNGADIAYEVSVVDNQLPQDYVTPWIYFSGKIDGVDARVFSPFTSDDVSFSHSGFDTLSYGAYVVEVNYPIPPGSGTLSVQKDLLIAPGGTYTNEDFKNFFQPGAYPIANPYCRQNGIILAWSDENWETYTTYYGSGEQGGSSFKITAIQDGYDQIGRYYVNVFARFNCKLYHYPSGNMKLLTDGEAVICFKRP